MHQAYRFSLSTELLKQLHWLPIEWRIRFKLATSTLRHCTLAIHLTLLIFCSIINPQCPRALLPVSYLQFHGITYPLVFVLFVSLHRNLELLNSSNLSVSNLDYLQTSLKDPLLLVSLFCHLASIILCPLILSETLALYKSFTYLLTIVSHCVRVSWHFTIWLLKYIALYSQYCENEKSDLWRHRRSAAINDRKQPKMRIPTQLIVRDAVDRKCYYVQHSVMRAAKTCLLYTSDAADE